MDLLLLKYIFGSQSSSIIKNELMITITHHVISGDEKAETIAVDFRRRTESSRTKFREKEKKENNGKK